MTGSRSGHISQMPMTPQENNPGRDVSHDFPGIDEVSYQTDEGGGQAATLTASFTEISSGPLPNPAYLERYDHIIPNGAERIMRMAEKEQENRHLSQSETRAMEKDKINRQLKYVSRGQIMAFVLSFVILGLATLFVFTGHEAMAYVLFAVSLVSLVGLFLGISGKK